MGPRILVIDNYDSFVYNLVQYVGELGGDPVVRRNDAVTIDEIASLNPDGILISPGPGIPADAGISLDLILEWGGKVPIFGVCLGEQCIGEAFGATIVQAPQIVHGKTSFVRHDELGVFEGLPNPLEATRYHSLVVKRSTVPAVLTITANTDDDLVMGLRHNSLPIEGVQFHPESILTSAGHEMVKNFLDNCERHSSATTAG